MFCIYTEVMAQDDTVTFEYNHASFSAYTYVRLTSPNYAFMRCRLYSNQKVIATFSLIGIFTLEIEINAVRLIL